MDIILKPIDVLIQEYKAKWSLPVSLEGGTPCR